VNSRKADTPVRTRIAARSLATGMGILAASALAAPPALETLFPCGGKAGATTTVTATGSNLDKGHPDVWADHPGITFKPADKPRVFTVTLAPDVPPGPHLVRFFNHEGASLPHVFMVGKHDEFSDAEPNDDHLAPQHLAKLPLTVHGRLEKSGDVDTFAVKLEAGRTFTADLQGYALGSQMDPAMKLLDARGVEVAMSHDTHNLDPFIRHEVKKAGIYLVQLMAFAHPPAADVTLKGGGAHIYRLTLSDQPFARSMSPCAVQRGQQAKATLPGGEVTLDATHSIQGEDRISVAGTQGETVLAALVTPPVATEKEPDNDTKTAQRIVPPIAISGVIARSGDEDRVIFTAKKGEALALRVHAAGIHSPMDASLRIEDSTGKVLQQADDADATDPDPALNWKAPADGDFIAVVSDLFQRGGPDFCYALEIAPPRPQVAATLAVNAIKTDAAKTADLKTTVKVTGTLQGKLVARITGLPPGVTAKEVEVPVKGGEVKLSLSAAPDAPAAGVPVEVELSTSAPDEPMTFKAAYDLRGTEPRGDRLINEDSRVWLTVTPSPKPPPVAASSPSASATPPAATPAPKP
jgi:hypothetical protein